MKHKILIHKKAEKKIINFPNKEKRVLTHIFDLMESKGQVGMPIMIEKNIWKFRLENIRIIYKIVQENFYILKVSKI